MQNPIVEASYPGLVLASQWNPVEAGGSEPSEHGLALKALHVAHSLDPLLESVERVKREIQKFEHGWRDRVRALRSQSMEERDRKAAESDRQQAEVDRLHAARDQDA